MSKASMINTGVRQYNPFPGSRPFFSAEDQHFFGRDEAVSELLKILLKRRFVALVGPSASGKTSLIQAGVIPTLLSDMKEEWVPVSIRPGRHPMSSLIRGFQKVFSKKISESDVNSFLKSSQSIGNFLIEKGLGDYHYFLVVDQFEELFTWPVVNKKGKGGKNPDALHFIGQLMKMVESEHPRIYQMLAIRSEFLEYCSAFRGFPEHLNRGRYLLSQMSRENLTDAILEPLRAVGTKVEEGLEEYILKELEEVEPQLPLLQHALKCTYDHWREREDPDQPVSLEDFQNSRPINTALNRDLENLYQSLEFYQKEICERIFKTIAFKTSRQEVYGRRTTLSNIARIARCNVDKVLEIVEIFERAGHPFLSSQHAATLSSESRIGLPHESLINIWDRLRQWVDEEDESIGMYLKLSKASAMYQQGKAVLLEAEELQKAIDWRTQENPSPAWGIQFDPAFERAMVFLNTSEEEYLWSEKRKIILKQRKRILNRSIVAGSFVVVVAIGLVIYISKNRPAKPVQQVQTGIQEPYFRPPSEQPATRDVPEETEELRPQVLNNQDNQQAVEMDDNRINDQREEAGGNNEVPGAESGVNTDNERVTQETIPARTETFSAADRERMILISIVKDAAYLSAGMTRNPDLQGLLAYESYLLNKKLGGDAFDPDIYRGLYEATKVLISQTYYIYPNIRHSVTDIEWLNRTGSILMVSSDGSIKILPGNVANRASQTELANTGFNNECLGISPDERIAAVGTSGGGMLFIELENRGEVIHQNTEQGENVLFIQNLGNSGSFLSGGTGNDILKWDYNSFTPSVFVSLATRPLALECSETGSRAAIATVSGRLFMVDVNNPSSLAEVNSFGSNPVRALDFSPGQRYLAAGMLDGSIKVLSGDGKRVVANLFGPGARVSAIEFSPDGSSLVAASNDGNVYMWNTLKWDNPPLVFTENSGFILSLCFSGNGQYFYSGSVAFPRLVGRPTDPDKIAENFCSLLTRNLTREEWIQYFTAEIPYEETCPR